MVNLPNINISLLLFFGGLALACSTILFSSIRQFSMFGAKNQTLTGLSYLDNWYVPNLKKWKNIFYQFLYWVRDISVRYWVLKIVSNIKLLLYKFVKFTHKKLLGTIRYLEHQEDQLKERLSEKNSDPSRSATESRLIRSLSRRKYSNKAINDTSLQ